MNIQQPQVIPAATVIIMRERAAAPPQLLMVERAATMRFAGGALVFPGGRIDPADRALAATYDGDTDDNAARIAAIRETIEEAGLPLGLRNPLDIDAARKALATGAPFGEVLGGVTLDLDALIPFARWRPDLDATHRIFDAHFYLARLPDDAPAPIADGGESVRLFWASARRVLADADAGRGRIIYPTRRNLERLARFDSFAAAVADARAHPVDIIIPWIEDRDGVPYLCIPEGLGYPITAQLSRHAIRE